MQQIGRNSITIGTQRHTHAAFGVATPNQRSTLLAGSMNPNGVIIRTLVSTAGNNDESWWVLYVDGERVATTNTRQFNEFLKEPVMVKPGLEIEIVSYEASQITMTWDDM